MNHPHLRPLSFGEILDGTFALYRRNFADFFLAALIPYLPVILFWIVLGVVLPETEEGVRAATTAQFLLAPYGLAASLLVYGSITHMAAGAYRGERISWREGYRAVVPRFFPLLGAMLLAAVIVFVGLVLLAVPGIIAAITLFALVPAVMVEKRGAIDALKRSRELASGARWRILGVILVLMIIVLIPSMALGVAGAMGIAATDSTAFALGVGLGFTLIQSVSTVISALATPLLAIGVLLLYYDRRVRAEGLDLELATEQLATAP